MASILPATRQVLNRESLGRGREFVLELAEGVGAPVGGPVEQDFDGVNCVDILGMVVGRIGVRIPRGIAASHAKTVVVLSACVQQPDNAVYDVVHALAIYWT